MSSISICHLLITLSHMDLESSVPPSPLCPCEKPFLRWAAIRCKSWSVSHVNVLCQFHGAQLSLPKLSLSSCRNADRDRGGQMTTRVQKATISHLMECKVCHPWWLETWQRMLQKHCLFSVQWYTIRKLVRRRNGLFWFCGLISLNLAMNEKSERWDREIEYANYIHSLHEDTLRWVNISKFIKNSNQNFLIQGLKFHTKTNSIFFTIPRSLFK